MRSIFSTCKSTFCAPQRTSGQLLIAAAAFVALCGTEAAHADYIQSLGVSVKCLSKAGACVADEGDIGAYYHNPAGAADFKATTIGGVVGLLDSRGAEFTDPLGTHKPVATSVDGEIAVIPTFGVYTPISSTVVIGLGLGAANGIIVDWQDVGASRFNSMDESLALFEASPTIAIRPVSWLNIGGAMNVNFARQLSLHVGVPGGGALGPQIGSLSLETDKDATFRGLPPGYLDYGLHAVSFTLGLKADVNDRLSIGVSGRTKSSQTFEGDAALDLTPVGGGIQRSRFRLDLDAPAHVQAGFTYKLIPSLLDVSFDIQRTFWSDTKGFGKPFTVDLATPLVLGVPVNQLLVDYRANDQNTYRFGTVWHAMPGIDLRAGYAYDEKIFDDSRADLITFDNNRHIFSVGGTYDQRASKDQSGWEFDFAFLMAHYEEKTIAPGQSANLGGLVGATVTPNPGGFTLGYGPNTEAATFGGNLFTYSIGATFHY